MNEITDKMLKQIPTYSNNTISIGHNVHYLVWDYFYDTW